MMCTRIESGFRFGDARAFGEAHSSSPIHFVLKCLVDLT